MTFKFLFFDPLPTSHIMSTDGCVLKLSIIHAYYYFWKKAEGRGGALIVNNNNNKTN